MSDDYYKTLGVQSNASQDEIKRAYKKLAKEHHPDVGSGNETKFKQVSEAHDTLKDSQKRQDYDLQRKFGSQQRGRPFGFKSGNFDDIVINVGDGGGFESIIEEFFGHPSPFGSRRTFRQRQSKPMRNQDIRINLSVSLDDIYNMIAKDLLVKTPDGSKKSVRVEIPVTADDGTQIKFTGLGSSHYQNLRPGDLYVVLSLYPHPNFTKQGYDLHTTIDIDVFDALLGTTITINHFKSKVRVIVPELTEPDSIIRLKGKGMPTGQGSYGNLYIKLNYITPTTLTKKQRDKLAEVKKGF